MITGIFDSHAHYDDEAFDDDRREILSGLNSKGVYGVINCGCDLVSSNSSLALSAEYGFIYAACGVHPHNCAEYGSIDSLESDFIPLWQSPKCVAIGEIGLDYHYDFSPKEMQLSFFEEQLKLSLELNLPVIVHDREAHEDTMRLLRKYKPQGVMHCFSGSTELAKEVLGLGMYVGLGGAVTFKNARKPLEVAAMVPQDRLLVETDCPYMTPVPFRGQRNSSDLIAITLETIALVRGISPNEAAEITCANAKKLFNIV